MLSALDADPKKLDEHEQNFVRIVRKHGWHQMTVSADEEGPGFTYTTGFWLLGFPEVVVFSLKPENASAILWDMFNSQKAGKAYPTSAVLNDVFADLPAYLLPVGKKHYREHLGWSRWFYGNDAFPCLQLIWPDRDSIFPWEKNFSSELVGDQPDLSEGNWSGLGAGR